jgi:hypothetical protein
VPHYNLAIEYDGAFWHESKEKEDRNKGKKLQAMSISLFRLRGYGLKALSHTDVMLQADETRHTSVAVIKELLLKILENVKLIPADAEKVEAYLRNDRFVNDREFRRLASCLPGPPPNESLARKFPLVADEWHFGRNDPLIPSMFSPGSNKSVWWICKNGHEWKTRIGHRTNGGNRSPRSPRFGLFLGR